jgi:hypothetical protein
LKAKEEADFVTICSTKVFPWIIDLIRFDSDIMGDN